MKTDRLQTDRHQKSRHKKRWTRDDTELSLLGLPCLLWFAVFAFLPMFGIIIAFKSFRIAPGHGFLYSLMTSDWVGLKNFSFFVRSNAFGMLLRNTVLYNIVFILLGVLIPVTLAVIIRQIYSRRAGRIYQTVMFFPHFMSWVVVSYFVYAFLSPDKGLLNGIIRSLGGQPVQWYSEAKYWPFILVFMQVWKTAGYSMVVYLAGIAGIDQSLYEAAVIDGASKWQQTRYITLPGIRKVIVMMFILNVGRIFYSDFGLFYQVTRHIPNSLYTTVSTFDTYIYQAIRTNAPIGQTAAASLFQSAACCMTILTANFIVSAIDADSAII
ncbi:MAG: ABC transporter permease subunit [Firmicutes bacterium]|nr:ABC transporter permease subunit [Bacillota bacterium]